MVIFNEPVRSPESRIAPNEHGLLSQQINRHVESLSASPILLKGSLRPRSAQGLEEKLFDALAQYKVATSKVSMHLHDRWRTRLFAQLDSMLDVEEWDELDVPPSKESFDTFLRMMLLLEPDKRPGLGSSGSGEIVAHWTTGPNRLTIECLPGDNLKWVLTRILNDKVERAAGNNGIERLKAILAAYEPDVWFQNAE